jgi:hypothetical protein
MIPLLVFVALILIAIPLFIYAFIDTRNKYYANIIAAFLVSIITAYLAVVISIGIVQYDPTVTFSGTFNTTTSECLRFDNQTQDCLEYLNTTTVNNICNTCPGPTVTDPSLGYIMLIISIIMMVYSIVMVYEAYEERRMDKEAE